jgi:PAS domain S-box-containing protein
MGSQSIEDKVGAESQVSGASHSGISYGEPASSGSALYFLTAINESLPVALIVVDQGGAIVWANAEASRLFGYETAELHARPVETLLPERFAAGHPALRNSFLSAPESRPMGAGRDLAALRKDGGEIPVEIGLNPLQTEQGRYVLAAIVDLTERRRLMAELQMAELKNRLGNTIELERMRLARELHDGAMQELYSVSYRTEEVRRKASPDMAEALAEVSRGLQEVVQQLRSTARELMPPALSSFGLEKALRSYAEDFQVSHPEVKVRLSLAQDRLRLPGDVRLALYRVAQQALTNVARHARASEVRLGFAFDEKQARLEIWDNGRGFSVPPNWLDLARGGHFGLASTAERMNALGGFLTVESTPSDHTLVRAVLPLDGSLLSVPGEMAGTLSDRARDLV